jgi:DNA-binding GntR family transcriptional regulator
MITHPPSILILSDDPWITVKSAIGGQAPRQAGNAMHVTEESPSATVGELVYRRIRADIVLGRLPPGQRLTLDRMRDAYGTSVGTLREMFNRLASEGLIDAEGSRGFQVTSISPANLREVAAMRQLLESHGLEKSFQAGDIEWEGRVVAAHHKLAATEKRLAGGERAPPEVWRRYDWAFHYALISACGSGVLLDMYAAICDKYLRYQMIAAVFRGQVAADEHLTLLDCALNRDWRRAQATLTTHIDDCVAQMLAAMAVAE